MLSKIKLKFFHGIFKLDIKKIFFIGQALQQADQEVIQSLSLEVSKNHENVMLRDMV